MLTWKLEIEERLRGLFDAYWQLLDQLGFSSRDIFLSLNMLNTEEKFDRDM